MRLEPRGIFRSLDVSLLGVSIPYYYDETNQALNCTFLFHPHATYGDSTQAASKKQPANSTDKTEVNYKELYAKLLKENKEAEKRLKELREYKQKARGSRFWHVLHDIQ